MNTLRGGIEVEDAVQSLAEAEASTEDELSPSNRDPYSPDDEEEYYRLVVKMSSHELVRRLNTHLGATLVAGLAGVKDRKLPYKWATANGPEPRDEALQRLQMAMRVWMALSAADNDYVARSWFVGMNPRLEEQSPVLALRAGRLAEVKAASRSFVEGIDE
ncbi:MAG TPA: hypothetical protein VIU11_06940 [Nakamurella sp.]